MDMSEVLKTEIIWPGEREFVAKVFRVDEMGLAWNESEKGPPVSIMTMERAPRVHDQPPSIPGIRDDVLKSIPSDTDSVYKPSQSKSCLEKERSARIKYDQRLLTTVSMRQATPPSYVEHFMKQSAAKLMYTTVDLYVGIVHRMLAKESRDLTMQWLATILVSNFRHILDFKITIR